MSRRVCSFRAVALASTVLGATFSLSAQDTASTPAGSDAAAISSSDGMAKAKRDFEAVKSARDPILQPKTDLPRVTTPEWHAGPPVNAGIVQPKTSTAEAKSANWLVDAMEQSSTSQKRRGTSERGNRKRDSLAETRERESVHGRLLPDSPRVADENERTEEKDRENALATVNPLTRYLGDWMTPQDYAVLKPSLTESLGRSTNAGSTSSANALGIGSLAASGTSPDNLLGSLAPSSAPFQRPAPRENPYLSGIEIPSSTLPKVGVGPNITPLIPPVSSALPSASIPPPAITSAPSKVPDFVKPATDDKYFKQLKRF